MTMTYDGTNGITFPDTSTQNTAGYSPFRNRIINGDMRIDQRNSGASVSLATPGATFDVDRFQYYLTTGSGHTSQQVSDAPGGFQNSLKFTVGTGAAPSAAQQNILWQTIEGYNVADLGFGASGSQTVTFSFWVKSSVTGTFNVWLQNSGSARSYATTYTINSISTWEYKTVTVVGDTAGTWIKNNGAGLVIGWSLGCGSNFQISANTWSAVDAKATSTGTSVIATSGATFQVTGVQLEKGSVATPFEYRPYGTELALCQRYYFNAGVLGSSGYPYKYFSPLNLTSNYRRTAWHMPVSMRAAPTVTLTAATNGAFASNMPALDGWSGTSMIGLSADVTTTDAYVYLLSFTASAEL